MARRKFLNSSAQPPPAPRGCAVWHNGETAPLLSEAVTCTAWAGGSRILVRTDTVFRCPESMVWLVAVAVLSLFPVELVGIEIATGSMLGPRYKANRFYTRSSTRDTWRLTYSAKPYRSQARGKLMALGLPQALFDDEILSEEHFDPDRNTDQAIEALDLYREHGVLAITVGLQGDSPGHSGDTNSTLRHNKQVGNQGPLVSAFRSDGGLKEEWLKRLRRLVKEADRRGMFVCLIYFQPGHDDIFDSPKAVVAATRNITDWLIGSDFRNVIIDIANEWDVEESSWDHGRFIPENIARLIEIIRDRFNTADYTLPIGASGSSRMSYHDSLAQACDLVLIHGNGRTPGEKVRRLREFQATSRAVWMTEDHNGHETTVANLSREKASADAVFQEGGGWGYLPRKQTQRFPFQYLPGETSHFDDGTAEPARDGAYFRAVLEHIAKLVLRKPPNSLRPRKKRKR